MSLLTVQLTLILLWIVILFTLCYWTPHCSYRYGPEHCNYSMHTRNVWKQKAPHSSGHFLCFEIRAWWGWNTNFCPSSKIFEACPIERCSCKPIHVFLAPLSISRWGEYSCQQLEIDQNQKHLEKKLKSASCLGLGMWKHRKKYGWNDLFTRISEYLGQ